MDKISNDEIRKKVKIPSVIEIMKKQRLLWFGHVIRIDQDKLAKQILSWEPISGKTRAGRPEITCKSCKRNGENL